MSPPARAVARVAAAALLLALLLWWVDPRALWQALRGADPGWLALGLASAVAANAASALRWWALARWLGSSVRAGWALATYFRGVAINALLPGAVVGGDLYRAQALSRRGLPLLEAGASVLVDRVGGLCLLVVVGALGAAFGLAQADAAAASLAAAGQRAGAAVGPAALAAGAVVALLLPVPLLWAWQRGSARAPTATAAARRGVARLAPLVCRRGLLAQYAVQVLASTAVQLLSIGTLACGGAALGVALPFWAWAAAAVPVFLMATLPVSFGGWGTREAAAVLALGAFGVAAPQAVAVAMLYGAAALAQAVAGLVLLAGGARE